MKLHYVPRTRASRPRWLLEELGAVHELNRIDVAGGQNKTPEYRAIHPHGSVPAFTFTEDGVTIVESAAICMAIADKFPEKGLAPKAGTAARALYYQWIVYVPATVDPTAAEIAKAMKLPEDQREAVTRDARARLKEILGFIDRSLGGDDYLIDNRFSVADIMVGGALLWLSHLGVLGDWPNLLAYVERLKARSAYQRAMRD